MALSLCKNVERLTICWMFEDLNPQTHWQVDRILADCQFPRLTALTLTTATSTAGTAKFIHRHQKLRSIKFNFQHFLDWVDPPAGFKLAAGASEISGSTDSTSLLIPLLAPTSQFILDVEYSLYSNVSAYEFVDLVSSHTKSVLILRVTQPLDTIERTDFIEATEHHFPGLLHLLYVIDDRNHTLTDEMVLVVSQI